MLSGSGRRRFLAGASIGAAAAIIAAGAPARAADPPSDADRAAIRDVIAGQIEAFRRDDGAAAFGYAAPAIRRMFGGVDRFMEMVREGYRPVYRPREFAFRDIVVRDGLALQKVHIVGPDGAAVTAFYTMERQPDGSWRIAGCSLGAPEERST
ncbi:MAG: DUF4864 domain-containing protein [Rhodospirillales bacterium]|nr:MAG: DUF4864 domain-containing protein [Rhodospirillales bacterium]